MQSVPCWAVWERVVSRGVVDSRRTICGAGEVEFTAQDTEELQRLVLESIANGSMAEPKAELSHLVRCTLISHQVGTCVVQLGSKLLQRSAPGGVS